MATALDSEQSLSSPNSVACEEYLASDEVARNAGVEVREKKVPFPSLSPIPLRPLS